MKELLERPGLVRALWVALHNGLCVDRLVEAGTHARSGNKLLALRTRTSSFPTSLQLVELRPKWYYNRNHFYHYKNMYYSNIS